MLGLASLFPPEMNVIQIPSYPAGDEAGEFFSSGRGRREPSMCTFEEEDNEARRVGR